MPSRVLDLLRGMDIFAELGDAELLKVARLLKERKFAENALIFAQGERGDSLFIVTQGRVRISSADQFGREKVLAFYGPGEFFGDMAVLTGAPRSATAHASTDLRLLQLRKDDFDVLVATNMGVMKGMLRVMVERQAAMNTRISQEAGASAGDVRGLVTVVFSPRGGGGKTTLATNLAVSLAQTAPDRVVLVDLDLLFGHVPVLLDLQPRTALAAISPAAVRALDRESFGHYLLTHADSSLRVLPGTLRPEESEMVSGEHVRAALELLRRQYVHVVVDAGSRFSEPCLAAIDLADQVLVVATPESVALRDARECQRLLRDVVGCPTERVGYVLNHPWPYADRSAADLAEAVGREVLAEVPHGGAEVAMAALDGVPLVMRRGGHATSRAIAGLARHLERRAEEALALGRA